MNKFDHEMSMEALDRVVGGADGDGNGTGTGNGGHGLVRGIKQVIGVVEGIVKSIWPF
ncbi:MULTISPECIES: hypothetical protein [unclassified Bradyrhizobium]|uniref:hypothetical protein n=1 Tax=unclassified Bradyrhizobium TaxID=2631580 RepID=UPI002EF59284